MGSFQQLVVGVDFSPHSERALVEAVRLQQDEHTGVTAVHVIDRDVIDDLLLQRDFSEDEIREQALKRLGAWLDETLSTAHHVAAEAVAGHPFDALVHAVERHHADLLVLGSRGINAGAGHPGAIAAKCLRRAPGNVLLIRQHVQGPFRKIVACVDFSEHSSCIVQHAATLAAAENATLDVLHIHVPVSMNDMLLDPFPPTDNSALMEAREDLAHRQLDKLLAESELPALPEPPRPVVRVSGSSTDGIVEYLREVNADLVTLGTRGRSGLRVLLLGTTAERLVHEAPCSVFTIKA